MFSSVGWGELLVLLVAGLVILGPERLPGAVSWTMKSLRQVREYAAGATNQLKDDLGPDFEDFRKPLAELNELRGMTPRSLITKHLLDGDDSFFSGNFDDDTRIKPVSAPMPEINPTPAPALTTDGPGPSLTKKTSPDLSKAARPDAEKPTPRTPTPDQPTKRSVVDWDAT
ncbi:MAG: Sec-independent protein translocase protein TatB [Corynebacteriales bacterium]|nr:Sec-independent protein translocase protein TatB [Mycobacteriales bacterium]